MKIVFILFSSILIFACGVEKQAEVEVQLNVTLDGKPAPQAKVLLDGIEFGITDNNGYFSKSIKKQPGEEVLVAVQKEVTGYQIEPWNDSFVVKLPKAGAVDKYPFKVDLKAIAEKAPVVKAPAVKPPAAKPEVAKAPVVVKPVIKKATISIAARTEAYGVSKGISGVVVNINNKRVGKTNAKGLYTYEGQAGDKVQVQLSAPGYIPEKSQASIKLKGRHWINRFFYPAKPKPIKVGMHGYVNNSPEEDLSELINRIEEAVGSNLFLYSIFREVPKSKLREKMLQASLDMETAATKGWQKTRLIRSVDMIVAGSVTKDDLGMTLETTVITADGNTILSQINRVRQEKFIKNTARVIVNSIVDQFPFEGTIDTVGDDGYRINLGKSDYKIRRGSVFKYVVPRLDKSGRVKGYRELGTLRVANTDETSSWAEIVDLKKGMKIKIGDKVVRRIYLDEEREAAKNSFVLAAKGEQMSLWGVNVYLNNTWVGTTGSNGRAKIPVRLNEEYDILLSRYGYQPVSETISVNKDKQLKEFSLDVASALFKVDSQPSGADVFVDGVKIGKTPILDGKPVDFGFRKIKLVVGGEYRDWERILEFNKQAVERIGHNKIIFEKDYLKIGKTAEQNGDIDAAIQAYASTERGHTDYSDARNRLAQLYLDEKNDYDSAIREFENVLSLPENKQIIYKQFAVTYTNLGHAYYEKGNQLVHKDSAAAAQNLAKAVQKLNIAKQNMRFFPTRHYEEALHDTYYYRAISYHKLFLISRKSALLDKADLAWREYFDFFPKKLAGNSSFEKQRDAAKRYWTQVKDLM